MTVCQGLSSQACGGTCYDPTIQMCVNDTITCINSCNGICYTSSQYCYNDTKICNIGDSVCNVQNYNAFLWEGYGPICYNASQLYCINNTLCQSPYTCGSQCLTSAWSICVNNETICQGFYYYSSNIQVCNRQQGLCYDNTTSVCLNSSTVCQGLNSQ
ncbi:unnamed protein product, partial [Adineta steineri]